MKLLGREAIGDRIENWWLHTGDDGKDRITVETVQDVEPIFDDVARKRHLPKGKDIRFLATIPATVVEEVCRIKASLWGVRVSDAYREVIENKTDRAKQIWAELLRGRDYRKFQAQG